MIAFTGGKIVPLYLLKKKFSPSFKFHQKLAFNNSSLEKLFPFHRHVLISWIGITTNVSTIRSNLQVAQKGTTVINPVYPRVGTMLVKILNFRLFESLKGAFSKIFCSPKFSLGSQILHCLCKNFLEYPPDIIVYIISKHFPRFKNYKILILNLILGAFFACAKTISAFVDPDLLLMIKMVAKSNARTYFCY